MGSMDLRDGAAVAPGADERAGAGHVGGLLMDVEAHECRAPDAIVEAASRWENGRPTRRGIDVRPHEC